MSTVINSSPTSIVTELDALESESIFVFREVMPNLLAPVLVYATLTIPINIGTEAALSFLGIGVRPPDASWGQMMAKAIDWYQVDPTFFVVPGVCLLLTVLAFTLLGDAFRDALDPKGAGR